METPKHIQFLTCQKVGILLILFVGFGFGFFMHGSSSLSSSSEEARIESNSNSNNSNLSSFGSFRKYIVKSYFEKYNSLIESNFRNFVVDELLLSSCKMLPDSPNHLLRASVLQRHLVGEGSHRHMSSAIRFHLQSDTLSELHFPLCKVIILERLPIGVFADPFELQHLLEHGVFNDVAVFGDTNLELPSFLSNRSVVEIHINVSQSFLLGHQKELEITIDIPLHARYPPLDESGYSEVEFSVPDLFLRCSVEGNADSASCLLTPTYEFQIGTIVWRVPSGIRAHTGIVSAVTFLASSVSALLIALTSFFYSGRELDNDLKAS